MRTWLLGLLLTASCFSPPEYVCNTTTHQLQSNLTVETIDDVRITKVGGIGTSPTNEVYHIQYTVVNENKTVTCTFVHSRWNGVAATIDCH